MQYIKCSNFQQCQDTRLVVIDNPKAKNALNDQVVEELLETLEQLENDPTVRFIVLKGAKDAFSAGGDIKMMRAREGMFAGTPNELRKNYQRLIQKIPQQIERMEKILIAGIDGPAIGAGLDLACMCDFRIGTEQAYFAESFAKIGLIPGIGGSYFLMRLVGYSKAMELTLTGRVFKAQEALELGVLNQISERDQLDQNISLLLDQLRPNSQMAMEMAKKSIRYAYQNNHQIILDLLSSYQGICQTDSDHLNRLT